MLFFVGILGFLPVLFKIIVVVVVIVIVAVPTTSATIKQRGVCEIVEYLNTVQQGTPCVSV